MNCRSALVFHDTGVYDLYIETMEWSRQNSHIFAVMLDEHIINARTIRGAPGEIFPKFGKVESSTSSDSDWDRSFLRAKQTRENGHGSGAGTLLVVVAVMLRFAVPAIRQYWHATCQLAVV